MHKNFSSKSTLRLQIICLILLVISVYIAAFARLDDTDPGVAGSIILMDKHFLGKADHVPSGEDVVSDSILEGLEKLGVATHIMADSVYTFSRVYNARRQRGDKNVIVITNVEMVKSLFWYQINVDPCHLFILDSWGLSTNELAEKGIHPSHIIIPYPFNHENTHIGYIQKPCLGGELEPDLQTIGKKGFIFGKSAIYWTERQHWDIGVWESIIDAYPELKLFSGNKLAGPPAITNLPFVSKAQFDARFYAIDFIIGMGNPWDSPTPFAAIACGVPFINPVFSTREETSNVQTRRLALLSVSAKSHARKLLDRTSQHLYAEMFSEPYVYHVDQSNTTDLIEAVGKILKRGKLDPFIPEALTEVEFLKRLKMVVEGDHCIQAKS